MSFILNTSRYGNHLKRGIGTAPATPVAKASNKTIRFRGRIEEQLFIVAGEFMLTSIAF